MLHSIMATQGLYEDRPLLAWVMAIGRDLELSLEQDHHFKYFIVDSALPNAFASSGGYVYVTRGLLSIINTDDELAAILAHEFVHVIENHPSKRETMGVVPKVLELPANILGMLTYKEVAQVINLPIKTLSDLGISAFSRGQEKEADIRAVDLMVDAFYDPNAFIHVLQRIQKYLNLQFDIDETKTLFADHPITEDRITYLEEKIYSSNQLLDDPSVGTTVLDAHNLLFDQNPSSGLLAGNRYIHPNLQYYGEFPSGWDIQISPVSVTAISPDKKSCIILSVEYTRRPASQTANYDLQHLNKLEIVIKKDTVINQMEAFYAAAIKKSVKYPDKKSQMLWIKLPHIGVNLKLVGISDLKHQHADAIQTCFDSFRVLVGDDLNLAAVGRIKLQPATQSDQIPAYLQTLSPKERQLFEVLNEWKPNDPFPEGHYMKTMDYQRIEY